MKMMAKTKNNLFVNKDWEEVQEVRSWFPSGMRECVRFSDGYTCKVEQCEICYVF